MGSIALDVVVAVFVFLQVASFVKTRRKIAELRGLFGGVENLFLKETSITPSELRSSSSLQKFLANVPPRHVTTAVGDDGKADYTDISLLALPSGNRASSGFREIVTKTNEYLCKNTGTSADLGILEDIADEQKSALEDEIHNSLNVPLYLGLAGTFIGIITGVSGIDFQEMFGVGGELTGLQNLLHGVASAMSASFVGLGLTVFNSAISYKGAVSASNRGKGEYVDFLRRELMPLLSSSMASALNSLRGVLGHFVDKFGRNLSAYADAAELLNDNLEKQHLVLEELNKLGLANVANKLAEAFLKLKDASEAFSVFQAYQQQLNSTIANVSGVVGKVQTLLGKFDEFSTGLAVVVANQNQTSELQREFQEAITTHFPTGSEARDVWRKEFDLFMSEGKEVSKSLSAQLTASTEHIRNFVAGNNRFFGAVDDMGKVLAAISRYAQVQAECYRDLKGEILNLRKDYKQVRLETIDLHKATLRAVGANANGIKEKQE